MYISLILIGLTFDLDSDKAAAHRDDCATLSCRASIGFPPFSTISFIKDGETVATSTSGQLQIDTKSVNANPFGLYICQLNASGVTFNKTVFVKEQSNHSVATHDHIILIYHFKSCIQITTANIRITIDAGNTNLCSGQDVSHIYTQFHVHSLKASNTSWNFAVTEICRRRCSCIKDQ